MNNNSNVLKFGMTQVFRNKKKYGDKRHLQNEPDTLVQWAEKWQCYLIFQSNLNLYIQVTGTWM